MRAVDKQILVVRSTFFGAREESVVRERNEIRESTEGKRIDLGEVIFIHLSARRLVM